MKDTEDTSSATAPSSSLAAASQSDLERNPTWAQQISFDDGFNLDLAGTSALAVTSQSTGAGVSSLTDPTSSNSPQPSRPLG